MAPDYHAVAGRLAAQPTAEKVIRNQLISEGYTIQEATARAAGATRRPARTPRTASRKALDEAVTTAVLTATAARKAAKKATRRATRRATAEAAAARVLHERQQMAAQFSEDAIRKSLRESTAGDLAAIATIGLSSTGQPAPAARTHAEIAVDPRTLSLEDLGLAATAGSAGSSPFWAGQTRGSSPFWAGQHSGGGPASA